VAIAAGAEWREEDYRTITDPYGDGLTATAQYDAAYPADPLVRTAGNNWYAGNYHSGHGYYHVVEGYLEANVPVLKSDTLGEANINGAVRQTKYSTSGNVTAWKLGGAWKTPIEGLRFRAVTSRDIRAPNLSELFAPPVVTNATVLYKGAATNVLLQTIGNSNLRPETARNTEVGVVLAEPKFLPGFSLSVDYFDIKVKGAISVLAAQDLVDLCVAGNQEICSAMLLNSPTPNTNFVRVQAFNVASLRNKGFDIEAVYRKEPRGLGPAGPGATAGPGHAHHQLPDQLWRARHHSGGQRRRKRRQHARLEGHVQPELDQGQAEPHALRTLGQRRRLQQRVHRVRQRLPGLDGRSPHHRQQPDEGRDLCRRRRLLRDHRQHDRLLQGRQPVRQGPGRLADHQCQPWREPVPL
jgi:hypothetical protein